MNTEKNPGIAHTLDWSLLLILNLFITEQVWQERWTIMLQANASQPPLHNLHLLSLK